MLCTELTKVKRSGEALVVEPLKCKRWSCEHCRDLNKKKVIAQAAEGEPTTMLTLTIRADYGTMGEQASRLVEAWRIIRKRWGREHHGQKLPFIAIFEAHPSTGRPHLHILLRAPYISQRWLSNRMRELAHSPVCDIRRVRSTKHAAFYVSKYVGKDLRAFPGCKRYWRSHDYADPAAGRNDRPAKVDIWVLKTDYPKAFAIAAYGGTIRAETVQRYRVEIDFRHHVVRRC